MNHLVKVFAIIAFMYTLIPTAKAQTVSDMLKLWGDKTPAAQAKTVISIDEQIDEDLLTFIVDSKRNTYQVAKNDI